ncbi:uncharacterized protein LOC127750292 [Frankliniella occidentalis]|uniref:Uncharacterized protein LOC127750292 n=1 Tax=Frankliniella occidentalis TaxID=133901 RepID=A0A9C6X1S4_FRAOC|nr:uncharacterized protein LOC127750292 [Frankliniella occidentalis]
MTACARTLKGIIGEQLLHIQCWSHKLDKLEKIPSQAFTKLNEYVSKTKQVFLNTRKRKHRYISFLEDKYGQNNNDIGFKKAKLFPMPVMTRWNSWVQSVDCISDYAEDIFEFVRTLDDSDSNAVEYFKNLEELDWKIVKAEAAFVVEHCAPVSDLLLLLEGNKYPLAHRLLPNLNQLLVSFTIIMESDRIKRVVGEKTLAALLQLPKQEMYRAGRRMRSMCRMCFDRLTGLIDTDTAKLFFESCASLFCPVKIMSGTVDTVSRAYKNIPMLKEIPLAQFLVQHGVLQKEVENYLLNNRSKKVDAVHEVLKGMLASENKSFAIVCLQVIFSPV